MLDKYWGNVVITMIKMSFALCCRGCMLVGNLEKLRSRPYASLIDYQIRISFYQDDC